METTSLKKKKFNAGIYLVIHIHHYVYFLNFSFWAVGLQNLLPKSQAYKFSHIPKCGITFDFSPFSRRNKTLFHNRKLRKYNKAKT